VGNTLPVEARPSAPLIIICSMYSLPGVRFIQLGKPPPSAPDSPGPALHLKIISTVSCFDLSSSVTFPDIGATFYVNEMRHECAATAVKWYEVVSGTKGNSTSFSFADKQMQFEMSREFHRSFCAFGGIFESCFLILEQSGCDLDLAAGCQCS